MSAQTLPLAAGRKHLAIAAVIAVLLALSAAVTLLLAFHGAPAAGHPVAAGQLYYRG